MDIATIIGFSIGFICLVVIGIGPSEVPAFIDIPSVAIVIGGAIAAVFISVPMERLKTLPSVVKNAFFYTSESPSAMIQRMVEFAEVARRDGILALANVCETIEDKFLLKGIQLAVDGTDPELIEQIMSTELEKIEQRHADGIQLMKLITTYGPAWGMIGTLIGLINMLKAGLEDPNKLTAGMAVALITTLYGSVMSNYLSGPIGDKLTIRNANEMLIKEIVLRGVMSIQSGDNPRIVAMKMKIFLPPSERDFDEE